MPNNISFYQCGVWFCVGLFTAFGAGLGFHLATALIIGLKAAF